MPAKRTKAPEPAPTSSPAAAHFRDRIKEFKRVKASTLILNPKNFRTHPPAQKAALEGILTEVGFAGASVVYETPQGLKLIDGALRKDVSGDQEVPVLVLNVTEEEADKLLATFDPLSAMAGQDDAKLKALLAGLTMENPALQAMLKGMNDKIPMPPGGADAEPQIDKAAELQKKWGTKPGDLWTLGGHRLLCGDATRADDVAMALGGRQPLLMVTDPPYGVDYDPAWRADPALGGRFNKNPDKMGKVKNDDNADWTAAWKLFAGDVAYVYHAGVKSSIVQASLERAGFVIRSQIVWVKDRMALSRGDYHWQHEPIWFAVRDGKPENYHLRHEPIWYAVREGKTSKRTEDRTQTTVWFIQSRDDSGHGHSTQKPLECMMKPLRNHTIDQVYDPFLGTGTTMVAAENMKHRCVGLEINPAYVAVILERMKTAFPALDIKRAEQPAARPKAPARKPQPKKTAPATA